MKTDIAADPNTPPELLAELVEAGDPAVRRQVAANPATPEDVLLSLRLMDDTEGTDLAIAGNPATTTPTPPSAARVASRRPNRASAGTAALVSRSTTPVVARAPSTHNPIETPCSLEVRGINDGSRANRAATVSNGAAGDATTGFCHLANRIA